MSQDVAEVVSAGLFASDVTLRRAALAVSARLVASGPRKTELEGATERAIAAAILEGDADLRENGIAAAAILELRKETDARDPLPVPDGRLDAQEVLRGLMPRHVDGAARLHVLVGMEPFLSRAAVAAVATAPEKARAVADALSAGPVLAPFKDAAEGAPAELREKAERATRLIRVATAPGFAALVKHPDESTRTRAAQVLALGSTTEAADALVGALADGDEPVKRAVLASVTVSTDARVEDAIVRLAKSDASWPVRVRATETLGRIGSKAEKGRGRPNIAQALAHIAEADAYALVREAALRSLVSVDRSAAVPVLRAAAAKDAETRVRASALELLGAPPGE